MTENTPENRATRIRNLLRTDHLNAEERKHVLNIVDEFSDRFYLPGDKLGEVPNFYHSIHTTDDVPINTRQYRYPPVHQDEIQRQVKALLLQGVIQPSSSPYNSPLWIVPKKPDAKGNKRWRMVIDFRALNEKTLSDKFPLPNITEILDKLGGAKYFTIFDIANGFHQVQMDPKDCPKTAFTTPDGHFEFVRMPFGLKNAPPTFQRLMNQVISGLENAHVFIDDMVVFSSSLREHEIKVKKLLNRLREFGLTLQIDKCEFLRKEVTYLGHILTENGVKPDPRKLQAVKEFPIPKTQKNVQQFLGLTGYYRRFIKDYSIKSKPLVQLLGKGIRFKWTEDQQKSFENLRDELCTQPILQYPDFNRPFIVTTDASDYAIGAVLSQGEIGNDLPIAYASRTLNKAERNYSATEKECLAMVYAVQYFRPYLYGTKFTLVTDHRPLVWLHSVKDPTSRLMKWRLRLLEYEYQVIHKAGKTNKNADALSRNPVPSCLPLIPRDPQDPDYKHIGQKPEIDTDSIGFRVRQLQRDRERRPKYQEENTSSDEEPARGKVQHSPIADRPRVLPNLSHEISMPDEHMETINFHPQANSTKITSTEEDVNLISFEEPSENTITENTIIANPQQDLLNHTPLSLVTNEGILQPQPVNETIGTAIQQPQENFDRTVDPYPFTLLDTDTLSTEGDDLRRKVQPSQTLEVIISPNTLTTEEGHYAHFIPADCKLVTPIGKLLLDTEAIDLQQLMSKKPQKGDVIESANGSYKVYSIIISDNFYDTIKSEDILNGLQTLKQHLDQNPIKSFRISAVGDFHKLPTNELTKLIKDVFNGTTQKIIICNCSTITPSEEDQLQIIREAHDSLIGGHKGVTKTYKRIRAKYQWPEMHNEIRNYIRKCPSCQEEKLVRAKTRQPMLITDTPIEPFDKVALDTVGPLPLTPSGNKYILTMQDCLTKYCIAVAIPNIRAATIADAFARHFIAIYGTPRAILTDKGTSFIGSLMKNLSEIFKIKQITTSGYRPQTNGSLERSHIVLTEYLKHYMDNYEDWDLLIPFAMFSYNTSVHEATNFSPYELIFGKPAREPSSFPTGERLKSYGDYLTELITHTIKIRNIAADNLIASKHRSKKYYDKHSRPVEFNVGDYAYALLEPRISKFDPHYVGPYEIINVTDMNNQLRGTPVASSC
uniref:uncharacterized protein LOC117611386 n=1 Tax=Osmia lignaria TaxID=473952 RepID=UPI001479031E|nr:uncharacterized protein LOC117611386 [Osmia lignaria]